MHGRALHAIEPHPSFMETLGAVQSHDGSRNIHDDACQQRRDGALALTLLSGLLTLTLKLGLLQSLFGFTSRKLTYYPISVLWCCAVAAFVESELKVCILVAALEVEPHAAVVAKAAVATVAAVGSQMLTYILLGWGEPGSLFPCCGSEDHDEDSASDAQPIDLLSATVRELRNGLIDPKSVPVVSLRCCLASASVLVTYSDATTITVKPLVLVGEEAEAAAQTEADIRDTELSLLEEQAAEENPAELPLIGDHELSLKMLDRAIAWLRCDCYGDFEGMPPLMNDRDVTMFGAGGGKGVLAFKQKWLDQPLNYDVDVVHEVDLLNRVVVVGFASLLKGREGRGTDVIQFDEGLKICGVDAIRHSGVGKK